MSVAEYLIGDVFDVLATMPDASVDLVLTSPPFLALRSYLPADHPDKHKEIGSEPTPAEFLDTLLALTAEWGRVLAPHGSICVELGDSYAAATLWAPTTRPEQSLPERARS
jgi:DNA modification methylase